MHFNLNINLFTIQGCNHVENLGATVPMQWWIFPPGWNRVKVSEVQVSCPCGYIPAIRKLEILQSCLLLPKTALLPPPPPPPPGCLLIMSRANISFSSYHLSVNQEESPFPSCSLSIYIHLCRIFLCFAFYLVMYFFPFRFFVCANCFQMITR